MNSGHGLNTGQVEITIDTCFCIQYISLPAFKRDRFAKFTMLTIYLY